MTVKKTANMTGAALALAAAGLFASLSTPVMAEEAKVHCYGINGCKGQNDCKTAENACKGQAVCKGHGFKATTLAECNNAGGKVGA
jgi:hypothetical protein